jgi:hypothetical protein
MPDKPSPDTIKPLHPRSFYEAQAMLTGYSFNDFYHSFVQHGRGEPNPQDFMMWDADTWELIGHRANYGLFLDTLDVGGNIIIPDDNWDWRFNPLRKYPSEEPT